MKHDNLNRRQAIRLRCLDCSGFSAKEVSKCDHTWCELHPFRLPRTKQDPKARDKAIKAYCKNNCMAGQQKEVELCPSLGCPLYKFRLVFLKKEHIEPVSEHVEIVEG